MLIIPEPPAGDTLAVPTFTVNLDLPAELRWVNVVAPYKDQIATIISNTVAIVPPDVLPYLELVAGDIDTYLGEPWASELRGVAAATDQDLGVIVGYNLCTSSLAS